MKKIGILGSTGSIGSQCLEIIKEHPQQFDLVFITANTNSVKLIEQAKYFKPKYVEKCTYIDKDTHKLRTLKEKPVLNILDSGDVPTVKYKPLRSLIVLCGTFITFIISGFIMYYYDIIF